LTANYDAGRLLPLGEAALAHAGSGGDYADRCIANARGLAAALAAEGLAVVGGGTDSHHVAVDVRALGGGTAAARRLAEINILLSEIGCPAPDGPDPAGAIRIGTQSVTTQGFEPADMPAVASLIARGLLEPTEALRAEVAAIRRKHPP
ncbi:MAG: glycine hydroxymethyltransferase, partial [Actinobacteria bacterium]|nr:glycine hydroxymethyltransferase [Actinomycetota bacterium]